MTSLTPAQREVLAEVRKLNPGLLATGADTATFTGEPDGGVEDAGPMELPFTDSGNGERFEALFGQDFRHCGAQNKWYWWTGCRWEVDNSGRASLAAKEVARRLYAEAAKIGNDAHRRMAAGWARSSESASRRAATLKHAAFEGCIPVAPADFDGDEWLLNVRNGVLDLRTGTLLPHRRDYLMTRLAPVAFDPDAHSALWERFLETATDGDASFAEFLMRVAGYCLTGSTREEKLFMVLGPGGTGKSTFLEALRAVLGDYACTSGFESFTLKRDAGVRNDIATLMGRRMVVSIETEEGKRLAEGLVKSLTGRDTISARFLYGEFFEYRPAFKLILAANDPPRVRHNDDAIWRRIVRLPFERVIPKGERDPELKERLTKDPAHQKAILAWAVRGCLLWQTGGLGEPERVRWSTDSYREDQNPLREFFADCCEFGQEFTIRTDTLRHSYERFAEGEGFSQPLGPNKFADALKAAGCTNDRVAAGRIWRGIRLRGGE